MDELDQLQEMFNYENQRNVGIRARKEAQMGNIEFIAYEKAIEKLRAVEAERDRLREALEAYHALAPLMADYLNDIGAMLAYSDLHRANQRAEEALNGHVRPERGSDA